MRPCKYVGDEEVDRDAWAERCEWLHLHASFSSYLAVKTDERITSLGRCLPSSFLHACLEYRIQ